MERNKKITIFNGPQEAFDEYISENYKSENNNYSLTQLVDLIDDERRIFTIKGIEYKEENKKNVDLLTVTMSEYASVTEAVTGNFAKFISLYNIKSVIIQNPPTEVLNNLRKQYGEENIEIYDYEYKKINEEIIVKFKRECNIKILGQEEALEKVVQALIIQQKLNEECKPIVIMLYGPSGVGKTETGRLLANIVGEKMFYNQFSMFQNEGYLNYLYGNKIGSPSFAKDLLNRTSNIIFLDEFDKANHFVYSAMYELFDTGIFEDNNFCVNLKNTLIICTSNYSTPKQICDQLGEPMFYRINSCIEYKALSKDVIKQLIEKYYNNFVKNLNEADAKIIYDAKIKEKFLSVSKQLNNARQIKNFIGNDIAKELSKELN